jgi:hypothetical protein
VSTGALIFRSPPPQRVTAGEVDSAAISLTTIDLTADHPNAPPQAPFPSGIGVDDLKVCGITRAGVYTVGVVVTDEGRSAEGVFDLIVVEPEPEA